MEKHRFNWLALLGICILAFTAFLDFTIVNTALPFIQKAFRIDILKLQWVANIFPIILSMTMIAIGKVADLLGRKRVFYFGVAIFAVAALFAGMSPNIGFLIFFRGLQALGASITFIASNALISEVFHEKERARAIGIYGGITGAGLMLGPFFGGILVGALDWRWVFWINLPLIAIGFVCCLLSLKGTSQRHHNVHMDWKGLCLLVFGLGAFMYGFIAGAGYGFSILIWILIAAGILSLGFLIYIDTKTEHPLLNFTIFKDNLILLAAISCAIAGVVSYVFMFFDPLLLEKVLHLSPYTMGLLIAVIPAAQVVISFGFNTILKWFSLANLLLISCITPLIAAIFHLFMGADTSLAFFIIPFALLGINWGLSNTAMITAVNRNAPPAKIGESIGTIATIWNMAGSILLAISTVIFHMQKTRFLPSFKVVIGFNLLFLLVVILAAIWVRLRVRK
jgi:MFS family permease